MKLIGIYIENFGCLHRYELKFSDGLTVIREDNGFGKTTLAEFIRAMFYGFPRAAKTLDKNKRKKYLPWSGGKCGGHLTFEVDGAAYRIERTFGATPRGDTFNLIDLSTNQKSTRFTENIGVELFQLDGESFERSTYMPQLHEAGPLTTDSIRAKLGDLVEDTNDINNFDKAVAALKNRRSTFVPYRGSGGSVAEARTQVSRLQEELDRTEGKREVLAAVQAEVRELEQQLERDERERTEIRERITRASQAEAAMTLRRQYEDLLSQHRSAAAAAADSRFAGGVPEAEAFEAARRDCETYLTVAAELHGTGLPPAEQAQLEELNQFFAAGIPGEETLEELASQHRQLLRLQSVAQSQQLTSEEARRLEELTERFGASGPDQKQIDEARVKLERIDQLRQENQRLQETVDRKTAKQKGGPGAVAALIAGILCLAAGIGLMAARSFVPGGILLGVGVLALIAGAYLGIRRMISRELSGNQADMQERLRAGMAEVSRMEWEVRSFVWRYVKADSLPEGLDVIQEELASYRELMKRKDALDNSRSRTDGELARCADGLRARLAPWFGEDCDFEQAVLTLRMKRSRILDLRAGAAAAEQSAAQLRFRAGALQDKVRAFLAPYYDDIPPQRFHSLLTQLRRECDEYTRAQSRAAGLEAQIAAFRREHPAALEQTVEENAPDAELLKRKERQLSERITEQTRLQLERREQARQLRGEIDRLPELQDTLERWREKKDTDQKNSETLDRTLEYLQQAKESLSGNYLGTIQRSFARYLGTMTGEDREKILVTGDLEVQLERQGQARELGYFSAGQTDLVMLCMRFALVDALFDGVKPFVVLDDPFVNLDDTRTEQALELLRELARDRQIIYLVCNSSRV